MSTAGDILGFAHAQDAAADRERAAQEARIAALEREVEAEQRMHAAECWSALEARMDRDEALGERGNWRCKECGRPTEARNAALEAALRWALQIVVEGADGQSDENGTPAHDCEFYTNPEKGACDFHDGYWQARALLAPEAKEPGAR